jgi:hypothetical protein
MGAASRALERVMGTNRIDLAKTVADWALDLAFQPTGAGSR